MFGSEILDVAIGLIFIYLLLSLISSAVQEGLEAWLKTRAVYLERGIRELLNDADTGQLAKQIYEHPVIYGLFHGDYDVAKLRAANRGGVRQMPRRTNLPSYIPRENFALAMLDYVARGPVDEVTLSAASSQPVPLDEMRRRLTQDPAISKLGAMSPKLRRALLVAIDQADGDIRRAQKQVEGWYDSAMDRVSGSYKRQTQRILCLFGITLAVVLNVDSLRVADYLYEHTEVRAAIVAEATAVAQDTTMLTDRTQDVRARVTQLQSLHLPVGWRHTQLPVDDATNVWTRYVAPVLGWLMTGLAVSFGAPFWFDILNKIMIVRSTVKPKEKSPDEASEDRQRKPPVPNESQAS